LFKAQAQLSLPITANTHERPDTEHNTQTETKATKHFCHVHVKTNTHSQTTDTQQYKQENL